MMLIEHVQGPRGVIAGVKKKVAPVPQASCICGVTYSYMYVACSATSKNGLAAHGYVDSRSNAVSHIAWLHET